MATDPSSNSSSAAPSTAQSDTRTTNTPQYHGGRLLQGSQSPVAPSVNASVTSPSPAAVFTPTSREMSGAPSSQGMTPQSAQGDKDLTRAGNLLGTSDDTNRQDQQKTSLKHRLDEDVDVNEQNKRQRTDHDREADVKMHALPSVNVTLPPSPGQSSAASRLHCGLDLLSLYGLDDMVNRLRRTDPSTGEKTNILRKSYVKQIKDLPGTVKMKPLEKPTPGELFGILNYPDEEWQIQKVMGKELVKRDHVGDPIPGHDPAAALLAKLGNAVKMTPGQLPAAEHAKWANILDMGNKEPKPSAAVAVAPIVKGPTAAARQSTHYSSSAPTSPMPGHGGIRARRQGTKRRYDDDSFEGYGEDYVDDHGETASNGGVEDTRSLNGTVRKKRKAVSFKN
jgi:hypothetical protein